MLGKVKKSIENMLGKKVKIVVNNIRNKNEEFEGFICEIYDRIFIINSNGIKRSFNYSDLITGSIKLFT